MNTISSPRLSFFPLPLIFKNSSITNKRQRKRSSLSINQADHQEAAVYLSFPKRKISRRRRV